jgi:hypothetical protein
MHNINTDDILAAVNDMTVGELQLAVAELAVLLASGNLRAYQEIRPGLVQEIPLMSEAWLPLLEAMEYNGVGIVDAAPVAPAKESKVSKAHPSVPKGTEGLSGPSARFLLGEEE